MHVVFRLEASGCRLCATFTGYRGPEFGIRQARVDQTCESGVYWSCHSMVGQELAHFGGESAAEEKLAEAEPVGRRRREERLSVGFAPQRHQRLAIYLPLPHALDRKLAPLEHGQ